MKAPRTLALFGSALLVGLGLLAAPSLVTEARAQVVSQTTTVGPAGGVRTVTRGTRVRPNGAVVNRRVVVRRGAFGGVRSVTRTRTVVRPNGTVRRVTVRRNANGTAVRTVERGIR